jgi:hypothetical protein
MPPFAGNAGDVEAVVQLLRWDGVGAPATWPDSTDPVIERQISTWLEEAPP